MRTNRERVSIEVAVWLLIGGLVALTVLRTVGDYLSTQTRRERITGCSYHVMAQQVLATHVRQPTKKSTRPIRLMWVMCVCVCVCMCLCVGVGVYV